MRPFIFPPKAFFKFQFCEITKSIDKTSNGEWLGACYELWNKQILSWLKGKPAKSNRFSFENEFDSCCYYLFLFYPEISILEKKVNLHLQPNLLTLSHLKIWSFGRREMKRPIECLFYLDFESISCRLSRFSILLIAHFNQIILNIIYLSFFFLFIQFVSWARYFFELDIELRLFSWICAYSTKLWVVCNRSLCINFPFSIDICFYWVFFHLFFRVILAGQQSFVEIEFGTANHNK